ncbi:hypothetical protein AB4851_07275 [Burkholderia sp. 22PA0099]|uniref:hypothetical protein n=1 Tax=Burkholderia sp. 22PA0099 TaxID=3237372 RepID=UPI0039C2F839
MAKRLIIDTNLLLLLVIGAVEEGRHIRNSKRLGAFGLRDYDNVLKIMQEYDMVFITPYIATEVSNLIDLDDSAGRLAYDIAKNLFSIFSKIEVDIDEDCGSNFFSTFGITDSSLIKLSTDYFVLTNDHRMLSVLYQASPEKILPYVVVGK